MKKKTIAIILEMIPIISIIISFILIRLPYNTKVIKLVIAITFLLSFLGIVFFFVGRKIDKRDKIVRIFGKLDCIVTLFIIIFYILVIFIFGL